MAKTKAAHVHHAIDVVGAMMKRFVLGALLVLVAGCHGLKPRPVAKAVYVPAPDASARFSDADWMDEVEIVQRRLHHLNVPAGAINRDGDRILVRLGDNEDATRKSVDDEIAKPQAFTFVAIDDEGQLAPARGKLVPRVKQAEVEKDSRGAWIVNVELSSTSAKEFEELTGRMIGKKIAMLLDDRELMRPTVQDKIPGGRIMITLGAGKSPEDQAREGKRLATDLAGSNLPFPLAPRVQ